MVFGISTVVIIALFLGSEHSNSGSLYQANLQLKGAAAIILLKKNTPHVHKNNKVQDSAGCKGIARKKKRTANRLEDKLAFVNEESDDQYEDIPDSDEDRRVRGVGSGRRNDSYWASQTRLRRKAAADKRRTLALYKKLERERKINAETGA